MSVWKHQKAFFFTMLAVLMVSVAVLWFTKEATLTSINKVPVTRARVLTAQSYVHMIQGSYLERVMHFSGKRSLDALVAYTNKTQSFVNNTCVAYGIAQRGELDKSSWITRSAAGEIFINLTPDITKPETLSATGIAFGNMTVLRQQFVVNETRKIERADVHLNVITNSDPPLQIIVELWQGNCPQLSLKLDEATIVANGMGVIQRSVEFPRKITIYNDSEYYLVFRAPNVSAGSVEIFLSNQGNNYSSTDTFNLTPIDSILEEPIMENSTIDDLLLELTNLTQQDLHLQSNISLNRMLIYQTNDTGPWMVGMSAGFDFSVNATLALWENKTAQFNTSLEIEGLDDPLYMVSTGGSFTNIFTDTLGNDSTTTLTKNNQWNSTLLNALAAQRSYVPEPHGPSFLMRLTNDTMGESICCGIESMIFDGIPQPTDWANASYVDYCFWSTNDRNTCGSNKVAGIVGITNASYNYRIASYHILKYNINASEIMQG
ncbi:hypothetical protein HZB01_00480 [Candidatus Woesearchaeota archaeon]|nr:hypothetical protein [Candidatus Woesearchaeota archaeon]